MIKWYYLLWSDAIYAVKSGDYKNNWYLKLGFFMSLMMFLNIKTPFILLHNEYMWLRIPGWSNSEFLSNIQNGINWLLPCAMLNYYLIFYKDKWKVIEKKYPHSNKKLYLTYFLLSITLAFGSVLIANLLGWV
jgi:hypothetical protein